MAGAVSLKVLFLQHRTVIGWIAAVVLIAVCFVLIRRGASNMGHPDPLGPTIYSKSAIGHAGFFELLNGLDIPVRDSELGSGTHVGSDALLVIAEPRVDLATLAEVRAMLTAPTVLLVLPKRSGEADAKRPNWLGRDRLLSEADVSLVLHVADPAAALIRVNRTGSWTGQRFGGAAPTLQFPQLIRSGAMQPLLAAPEGILIGQIVHGAKKLVVISDPDLIANFGLARGNNASIAVRLITSMRSSEDNEVIFDELVHGFKERPFHILGILFQFPFVLVTVQIMLAAGLLCWAATGRLGAPLEAEPALAAGKLSLIETGANLLNRRGNLLPIAQRYFEANVRDAAYRAHAPRALDVPELLRWLAKSFGASSPPAMPEHTSDEAALAAAREIFNWRRSCGC